MCPSPKNDQLASEFDRTYISLAVFGALIGQVTSNLRLISVYIDKSEQKLHVYFYYDGFVDEMTNEAAVGAIDEIASHFSSNIHPHIERLDFPTKIEYDGWCMFARFEPVES